MGLSHGFESHSKVLHPSNPAVDKIGSVGPQTFVVSPLSIYKHTNTLPENIIRVGRLSAYSRHIFPTYNIVCRSSICAVIYWNLNIRFYAARTSGRSINHALKVECHSRFHFSCRGGGFYFYLAGFSFSAVEIFTSTLRITHLRVVRFSSLFPPFIFSYMYFFTIISQQSCVRRG